MPSRSLSHGWIFPLLGLVQIAPVTAAEFLGITRNLSDWLWGEGRETAAGEGCVGEPRAVRGVPVGSSPSILGVLLLEGAIGGAAFGGCLFWRVPLGVLVWGVPVGGASCRDH